MLLDPLVTVIETLKDRIHAQGATLRENETRTRMALIDPLLSVLGWDTSDPTVVTPEYNVSGRWADYALLGPDGKPAATVEAKKLGEPLEPHRMQMLNYSNASGVAYAGLTDGDRWELYEVFRRGQLEERRILDVSITSTPLHRCALELLLLWRANLAGGRPAKPQEPISTVSENPSLVALLVDSPASTLTQSGSDVASREHDEIISVSNWTPITQINPKPGDTPPAAVRINHGVAVQINSWSRVLIETAEWLCGEGKLTAGTCPIEVGRNRNLLAIEPMHRHGREFRNRYLTRNGLFLECNYSSKHCVELTKFLLKRFSFSEDLVELMPR